MRVPAAAADAAAAMPDPVGGDGAESAASAAGSSERGGAGAAYAADDALDARSLTLGGSARNSLGAAGAGQPPAVVAPGQPATLVIRDEAKGEIIQALVDVLSMQG
eukprot:gene1684-10149_t